LHDSIAKSLSDGFDEIKSELIAPPKDYYTSRKICTDRDQIPKAHGSFLKKLSFDKGRVVIDSNAESIYIDRIICDAPMLFNLSVSSMYGPTFSIPYFLMQREHSVEYAINWKTHINNDYGNGLIIPICGPVIIDIVPIDSRLLEHYIQIVFVEMHYHGINMNEAFMLHEFRYVKSINARDYLPAIFNHGDISGIVITGQTQHIEQIQISINGDICIDYDKYMIMRYTEHINDSCIYIGLLYPSKCHEFDPSKTIDARNNTIAILLDSKLSLTYDVYASMYRVYKCKSKTPTRQLED
jgi:hypothetical protein